jgi:AbrB family looped-hinge helix DNA binding protein
MSAVIISTKGQIVLPIALRKALGLKPGMRVNVKLDGKGARLTPASTKKSSSLQEIQSLLKYEGPVIAVSQMHVTDYKE